MKNAVIVVVVLLAAIAVHAAQDNMFSYIPYASAEWNQVTTASTQAGEMTTKQKVYYKTGKMRIEGTIEGEGPAAGTKFVTILTNDEFITYDPKSRQGMTYPVESDNNPQKSNSSFEKCRKSAKKTGAETLNGMKCGVYEYTCKTGGNNFRIKQWISEKDKFPVKTIMETAGMKSITVISGLNTPAVIDDAVFNPEKGVKITDMAQVKEETGGFEYVPEQAEVDEAESGGEEFGETDEEKQAEIEAKKEMIRQMWGQ